MRELKFRVWDKDLGKYLEGCEIDSLMAELSAEGDGREVIIKQLCPARYIFEQYTGFKDKNGQEIAEGDIIVDFDEFISVVDGSCAVISEKTCREKYFDEDDCSLEQRTRPLIRIVNDYGYYPEKKETQVEVIGNIHENHELLEEE